ncbi:MAG: MFS transporter [Chloroflexota bacterium]
MLRFVDSDLGRVLQVGPFRSFAVSRIAAGIAQSMLQAIIAWQVYAISGSALSLGIVGLVRFAPALGFSLITGVIVDTYDRQKILLASQVVPLVTSLLMLVALANTVVTLPLVYAVVFIAGIASAFEGPARQSLIPALVPRHLFPRAMTVNSTLQSLAAVSGPAVAGGLIAWQGVWGGYVAHAIVVTVAILVLLPLRVPALHASPRAGVSVNAIRDGLAYVRHHPVVLGAMSLDMFAVIFGGAKALLPIYAVDILHADAIGYGILTAALECGALSAALLMVTMPAPTQIGRTLLASVAAFGLATVAFGVSHWLPLSVLTYALVGAADQVSVVMRLNTVQLTIPDELRGRVTAVNFVFVNASNQIGGLESGVVAALTNAVFAVVSGGFACLAVVGLIAWRIPELRQYQARPRGAATIS